MRPLILIALFLGFAHAGADTLTGKIVAVSDGDTVRLLDANKVQHKIRLAGIDAPEFRQAFGQRSKQHLAELIHGQEVVAECGKVDKYQRQVCKILRDGQDMNIRQIEGGLAWWYQKYSNEQPVADQASYEAAEVEARNARKGLAGRRPDAAVGLAEDFQVRQYESNSI